MPNRKTHRRAGRISGAVYAAHRSRNQTVGKFLVETAAGACGGDIGTLAADWLEPATSSWHRGTAHSCAAGSVILSLGEVLESVETYCRQQADLKAAERMTLQATPDPVEPNVFVAGPNTYLSQFWDDLRTLLACCGGFCQRVYVGLYLAPGARCRNSSFNPVAYEWILSSW